MRKLLLMTVAVALLTPLAALAHGDGRVMGTASAIEGNTLTIEATDGDIVTVEITEETEIYRGKVEGTREDITIGVRIVVDYGKDMTATKIHLPAAGSES